MSDEEFAAEREVLTQYQAAEMHRLREESESRLEAEAVARFGKQALGAWAPLLLGAVELYAQGLRPEGPIDALHESLVTLILRCLTSESAQPLEELTAATSAMISLGEGEMVSRDLFTLVRTHRANRERSEQEKTYLHELPDYENRQKRYRSFRDAFDLDVPSREAHRPGGSSNLAH